MFAYMKTENNTERLEIRISRTLKKDMNKHIRKNKSAVGSSEFIRGLIVREIYSPDNTEIAQQSEKTT